jgi:hypothetical protein
MRVAYWAAAFALASAPTAANAALVTIEFAGLQTGGTVSLPSGPTLIAGKFAYDDAAADVDPSSNYRGFSSIGMTYTVLTAALDFVCGGASTGGPAAVNVINDRTTSVGTFDSIVAQIPSVLPCLAAGVGETMVIALSGPSTTWSDVLPTGDKWSAPGLTAGQILLLGPTGERRFVFDLVSIGAPPSPVPLPAAAPLFLIGLAAASLRKRTRKS